MTFLIFQLMGEKLLVNQSYRIGLQMILCPKFRKFFPHEVKNIILSEASNFPKNFSLGGEDLWQPSRSI